MAVYDIRGATCISDAVFDILVVILINSSMSTTIGNYLKQRFSRFVVYFQMSSQMACFRGYIVTLAAFVWLFSTVRFQMCLQIACMRRCKVTLVAFVWLFSAVRFQMCPQMACLRGCIVTLVAFV